MSAELKKYKSHKVVEGFKIAEICHFTRTAVVPPHVEVASIEEDWWEIWGDDGEKVRVSASYKEKHEPKLRGYYVRYEDGYESFSTAEAFETGYTLIEE